VDAFDSRSRRVHFGSEVRGPANPKLRGAPLPAALQKTAASWSAPPRPPQPVLRSPSSAVALLRRVDSSATQGGQSAAAAAPWINGPQGRTRPASAGHVRL